MEIEYRLRGVRSKSESVGCLKRPCDLEGMKMERRSLGKEEAAERRKY